VVGRLDGKVAIVTGAGSSGPGMGNGKATAVVFAREGARVLCVDRAPERAEETVALIREEKGTAEAFGADVSRGVDCRSMVAAALECFGRLDVLHNNVGIVSLQGLADVTEEEWDRVMAVNVRSVVLAAQAAAPHLEAAGGGAITNVSSIAGLRTYAQGTAYSTSKAAVIGLTQSLAGQLGHRGIRVNCIAPGQVWTPLVAGVLTPTGRETRRRSNLLQEEGTPWDIAWAAVYLASDEARWTTGHVLVVDAGLTLTTRDPGTSIGTTSFVAQETGPSSA
jgi:NAD(P)-dependent dehydrogenase (short-subunit alcohol dehydrogenase family)